MPKTKVSAPGNHQVVEDHPVYNKPSLQERGEASLRDWGNFPELREKVQDRQMDETDAISNQLRK